jgi:archaemetzincin
MRYDPAFDGIEDEDAEKNLLMYACHVMAHEIGHMFGLYHCIYYECLMNGINSADEQRRNVRIFCPVCLKKLKCNLKFNVKKRFEKLIEVCQKLGFEEETQKYIELLKGAEKFK